MNHSSHRNTGWIGRNFQFTFGFHTIAILAICLATAQAHAFTGTLSSSAGEIQGTGNWLYAGPTALSWQISENIDGSWSYLYDFSHPRGETSHFILEVSPTFTLDQMWGAAGDFEQVELGTWTADGSNPGMPGSIFGLKFDEASGVNTQISFECWRAPVWGDFFSKDGTAGGHGINAAWNAGFTAADTDPADVAADGSLFNHLLVPDTQTKVNITHPAPEPTSVMLLGMGLVGAAFVLRRRRA